MPMRNPCAWMSSITLSTKYFDSFFDGFTKFAIGLSSKVQKRIALLELKENFLFLILLGKMDNLYPRKSKLTIYYKLIKRFTYLLICTTIMGHCFAVSWAEAREIVKCALAFISYFWSLIRHNKFQCGYICHCSIILIHSKSKFRIFKLWLKQLKSSNRKIQRGIRGRRLGISWK